MSLVLEYDGQTALKPCKKKADVAMEEREKKAIAIFDWPAVLGLKLWHGTAAT